MKRLELETSKGKFVIIDFPEGKKNVYLNKYKGISLKEITEEQASEIVVKFEFCNNHVEELFSRIKSKGIHLFKNIAPLPDDDLCPFSDDLTEFYKKKKLFVETEQITFYNPYIFSL